MGELAKEVPPSHWAVEQHDKLLLAAEQGAWGTLPAELQRELRTPNLGDSVRLIGQHIATLSDDCAAQQVHFEPVGGRQLRWPWAPGLV